MFAWIYALKAFSFMPAETLQHNPGETLPCDNVPGCHGLDARIAGLTAVANR